MRDLVELPLYAGIEVRNMTAAVAFLAGARHALEQAAPGAIRWAEAGRQRDVPFVAVRAGSAGGDETRDVALYYAFCKSALVLSLSESALRRRIDDCLDGKQPRTRSSAGSEGPQWILDMDVRERGPLWWRLALMAAAGSSSVNVRWSMAAAEAVLRAAPGASPSVVRALARDTLGAIPVTPEGYAYVLGDSGMHDPAARRPPRQRQARARRPARQRGIAVRPPRPPDCARAQRGGVRRRAEGGRGRSRPQPPRQVTPGRRPALVAPRRRRGVRLLFFR